MNTKVIICPFCKKKLKKDKIFSEMNRSSRKKIHNFDFLKMNDANSLRKNMYNCTNCGCAFSDLEYDSICFKTSTKISKKEFFDIIFEALCDIFKFKEEDKSLQRRHLEQMYKGVIKTYYKEIAELQAEAFYEANSEIEGYILFKELLENEKSSSKKQ